MALIGIKKLGIPQVQSLIDGCDNWDIVCYFYKSPTYKRNNVTGCVEQVADKITKEYKLVIGSAQWHITVLCAKHFKKNIDLVAYDE